MGLYFLEQTGKDGASFSLGGLIKNEKPGRPLEDRARAHSSALSLMNSLGAKEESKGGQGSLHVHYPQGLVRSDEALQGLTRPYKVL